MNAAIKNNAATINPIKSILALFVSFPYEFRITSLPSPTFVFIHLCLYMMILFWPDDIGIFLLALVDLTFIVFSVLFDLCTVFLLPKNHNTFSRSPANKMH